MNSDRRKQAPIIATLALVLALSACGSKSEPEPTPEPSPTGSPVSIIRPDIVETPSLALEPLEASVSFADGGTDLSDAAQASLRDILDSPQMAAGEAITLRGHTDSAGYDEANLRASEMRANAVRDWLVEQGVEEERITLIALGEQRPVEPNANLDGTPNETGREANRRVDVTIAVPEPVPADPETPAEAEPYNGNPSPETETANSAE